jgi:hypothetical protein
VRGLWVTVVKEFGERVRNDPVVDGDREKSFLSLARKLRPYLESGMTEQRGDLVFVHVDSFRLVASFLAISDRGIAGND